MNLNKYAADKLKSLRMRRNLTQEELAEDLNITQQQVARYENNLRQFKQDFLFQLAEYFNVSINEFFPPLNNIDDENNQLKQLETSTGVKISYASDKELTQEDYVEISQLVLNALEEEKNN